MRYSGGRRRERGLGVELTRIAGSHACVHPITVMPMIDAYKKWGINGLTPNVDVNYNLILYYR